MAERLSRSKRLQMAVRLDPRVTAQLKARARELGYSSLSQYVRCLLALELREGVLPTARRLLGRAPREIANRRPFRARPTHPTKELPE
jgi:hypothetical protein